MPRTPPKVLKTAAGDRVLRRGRPPEGTKTGHAPLRFIVPEKAAADLRALHARTFAEHSLQFGTWLAKGVCAHYGVDLPPPGKPGPKSK